MCFLLGNTPNINYDYSSFISKNTLQRHLINMKGFNFEQFPFLELVNNIIYPRNICAHYNQNKISGSTKFESELHN